MRKMITTLAVASTFALSGLAGIASAQSTSTNSVTPTDTTMTTESTSSVGVPNTGLGGDAAMNYAILTTSAAVAIAAGAYALRSRRTL